MKKFHSFSNSLLVLVLAGPVGADTIYSDYQNIGIPATLDGVYLNVETGVYGTTPVSGWDINPFFGGVGVANNSTFQPARVSSTASLSTIRSFTAGSLISGSLIYSSANSTGGSQDHLGLSGTPFIAQQEGYLGFRLNDTGYGWMRVVFDGTGATAAIKDWAYDSTGTIAVGNVLQSGSTYTLDSSTQSFTLGSAIGGGNSVVKTGTNTVTLGTTSTYSGTTTVNQGTLALTGSIANSSVIIVGASTTLNVAGVSGGWTLGGSQAQTLSGTGTVTGAATIGSQGILAPGNSPGDLTFSDSLGLNGSLDLEVAGIGSGQFDRLLGVGTNTLTLGGTLNLFNTGYTPVLGDSITVFSGWGSLAGGFTTVTGTDLGGGLSWDTSTLNANGSLTVIPEPAAALLGGFGVIILLRRRRAASSLIRP